MLNREMRITATLALVAVSLLTTAQGQTNSTATNKFDPARWEKDIRAFELADRTNPPPADAVLFVGSSSIRRWTNLTEAFPKHRVYSRGFGGSHLSDSVAFANRIVIPYRPKMVLLYAGDNDLVAGKMPERVFADFQAFVQKVHAALPGTRIAYIAIKPCPAREKLLTEVKVTNRLIADYCRAGKNLDYLDVFTPSLGPDGKGRPELYVNDGLHPNVEGYRVWASVLRPYLDRVDPP